MKTSYALFAKNLLIDRWSAPTLIVDSFIVTLAAWREILVQNATLVPKNLLRWLWRFTINIKSRVTFVPHPFQFLRWPSTNYPVKGINVQMSCAGQNLVWSQWMLLPRALIFRTTSQFDLVWMVIMWWHALRSAKKSPNLLIYWNKIMKIRFSKPLNLCWEKRFKKI